jgi:hypothetical protein
VRRKHLGALGRERVESDLGWHVQAQKLLSVYERLFPGSVRVHTAPQRKVS